MGILEGDIYYFAILANAAEQANVVRSVIVKAQPVDVAFVVAFKCALKRIFFCADGRPLRAVYEDVVRQFGADSVVASVYLIGKPAQFRFVMDLVITIFVFWGALASVSTSSVVASPHSANSALAAAS